MFSCSLHSSKRILNQNYFGCLCVDLKIIWHLQYEQNGCLYKIDCISTSEISAKGNSRVVKGDYCENGVIETNNLHNGDLNNELPAEDPHK